MSTAPTRFASFAEFYRFYLSQHQHRVCRRLHFTGSLTALAAVIAAVVTRNAWWLVAALLGSYGLAWIGHFFFEKNRPATFSHPFYSLLGDWVMVRDMLTGDVPW